MSYLTKIERGVIFIESRLKEKCRLKDIAAAACMSPFHFHRIFTALTGETPGDYIRSRRLTEASIQLSESETRIIDIAFDWGYESQEAFSRAFKKQFEETPSKFRSRKYSSHFLRRDAVSRKTLEHLTGGLTLEPKIISKEAFTLAGIDGITSKNNIRIGEIWQRFFAVLPGIPGQKYPGTMYGVGEYSNPAEFTNDTDFTYFTGVEIEPGTELPEGLKPRNIPERRWAVFTHKGGVDTIPATFDYIYGPWIARTKEIILETDDMEYYDSRFNPNDPESSEMDIYIPVK